jgi:hypothetical protein
MNMPPESKSTNEATDQSELSTDDQITELLMGSGETGDTDEEAQAAPESEEQDAPQDDKDEEANKPETSESKQEDAEEEAATWGQALGLDDSQIVLDDNGNFTGVMTKIEGETKQVDLRELVKGYQLDSYNTNRSKAMADERKQFEEYAKTQAQTLHKQMEEATGLVDLYKQQLVGEYDSINWEGLRAADPAEYAARRQDFAVKYNQVQQAAEGLKQEQQQTAQQAAYQAQQVNYQRMQQEAQKALEAKPEWTDPEVRVKAINNMGEFIQNKYGYSPEEVAGITDHRVIGLIEDAMAYQAIKTKSGPKLKKAVPKFQKPGGGNHVNAKQSALNKLYKKAAASSSRDLKDDAITQLLMNS